MNAPSPRARRPINAAGPVPPRVRGNNHARRRFRFLLIFGGLLLLTLIMIAISLAF